MNLLRKQGMWLDYVHCHITFKEGDLKKFKFERENQKLNQNYLRIENR